MRADRRNLRVAIFEHCGLNARFHVFGPNLGIFAHFPAVPRSACMRVRPLAGDVAVSPAYTRTGGGQTDGGVTNRGGWDCAYWCQSSVGRASRHVALLGKERPSRGPHQWEGDIERHGVQKRRAALAGPMSAAQRLVHRRGSSCAYRSRRGRLLIGTGRRPACS